MNKKIIISLIIILIIVAAAIYFGNSGEKLGLQGSIRLNPLDEIQR